MNLYELSYEFVKNAHRGTHAGPIVAMVHKFKAKSDKAAEKHAREYLKTAETNGERLQREIFLKRIISSKTIYVQDFEEIA